jgi:hypothetical protein
MKSNPDHNDNNTAALVQVAGTLRPQIIRVLEDLWLLRRMTVNGSGVQVYDSTIEILLARHDLVCERILRAAVPAATPPVLIDVAADIDGETVRLGILTERAWGRFEFMWSGDFWRADEGLEPFIALGESELSELLR